MMAKVIGDDDRRGLTPKPSKSDKKIFNFYPLGAKAKKYTKRNSKNSK
jgi:hypothetical protein